MKSLRIITDKLVALDSPDHIEPWGTARDSSVNLGFNRKLSWWIPSSQLRCLDLGCSGGGYVESILKQGGFAVGVEGSDYSKIRKRASWATIPENLFTGDLTEPFRIVEDGLDGQERPVKFNVVTAWEVMEHIRPERLASVSQNILNHLMPQGVAIMAISPNEEIINGVRLHQTVQKKDWWISKFSEFGFKHHEAILSYFGFDWIRGGDNAPDSMYLVLTRSNESLMFESKLKVLTLLTKPLDQARLIRRKRRACASALVQNKLKPKLGLTQHLLDSGMFGRFPMRVVDAGSREGFESHWDIYGDQIELIGFEPDAIECARLNKSSENTKSHYPFALSREKGVKTLYLTRNGQASSFLRPNLDFVDRFPHAYVGAVIGTAEVRTTDLDSFLAEKGLDYVDFMKIDVEGAELEVLQGANQVLTRSLLGLSVEVFFQPYRTDSPSFGDIDRYLREFGFALFDLRPERWCRKSLATDDPSSWYGAGQIIYAQAIYFRDLVAEMCLTDNAQNSDIYRKVLKLASLAEIFGFPDFSIELLQSAAKKNIVSQEEMELLTRRLSSSQSKSRDNMHSCEKK